MNWKRVGSAGFALLFVGCVGQVGDVQIFLDAEDTVTDGLQAGNEEENIVDGWNVEYDKFLLSVGNFRAASAESDLLLSEPNFFVVDFKNGIPAGGLIFAEFEDIDAVRFDQVGYDVAPADAVTQALGVVDPADLAIMQGEGLSWLVEGRMVEDVAGTGQSCDPGTQNCLAAAEIPFQFKISSTTTWDNCEEQEGGNLGFAVPAGATIQAKPTLHGDHWWFSNFTVGVEITERRGQYIADAAFADIQAGNAPLVTLDILAQIDAAAAFPADIYTFTGSPLVINNAADYVVAQAGTNGHLNGEGECPTITVTP